MTVLLTYKWLSGSPSYNIAQFQHFNIFVIITVYEGIKPTVRQKVRPKIRQKWENPKTGILIFGRKNPVRAGLSNKDEW